VLKKAARRTPSRETRSLDPAVARQIRRRTKAGGGTSRIRHRGHRRRTGRPRSAAEVSRQKTLLVAPGQKGSTFPSSAGSKAAKTLKYELVDLDDKRFQDAPLKLSNTWPVTGAAQERNLVSPPSATSTTRAPRRHSTRTLRRRESLRRVPTSRPRSLGVNQTRAGDRDAQRGVRATKNRGSTACSGPAGHVAGNAFGVEQAVDPRFFVARTPRLSVSVACACLVDSQTSRAGLVALARTFAPTKGFAWCRRGARVVDTRSVATRFRS